MTSEAHKRAAERLADMPAVQSLAYVRKRDSVSWEGSHADLVRFYHSFIRDLQCRGYPMFAHCFVRPGKLQDELYHQGVSKARAGQSPHNHGMAVDVVHFSRFWNLDKAEWSVIGQIGKEVARKTNIKMTWGGDWRFYDPAHWELADWKARTGNKPIDDLPFSEAFRQARASGAAEFVWRGNRYTTKTA